MPRVRLSAVLLVASAAAAAALFFDGRRLAEDAGRGEVAARAADERARQAEGHAAALADDNGALRQRIAQLETGLQQALQNAQAIGEVLGEQVEAYQKEKIERESAAAMAEAPMPSGVARCVATLRDCLVADGFSGITFLSARELAGSELHTVEVLDAQPGRASSEVIVAERMTATLDRARGVLALRFWNGTRRALGLRVDLPDGGYEKRFSPVNGPVYETRLPFLVRAIGDYPVAAAGAHARAPAMDRATRQAWIDRVDGLLARAHTEVRLHLDDFRDLDGGWFHDAQVVGDEQGKTLAMTAACRELAVEVDAQAGIVSLLLREGTMRSKGGQSKIAADGYRILLPDVTPKAASDALLGMVVRR
jgi:hypothetical protein